MDYYEQKVRQFDALTSTVASIPCVELRAPDDHPLVGRDYIPVNPCVCFTEPCDCDGYDHGNTIVWLPRAQVLASQATGRYTTAGDAIMEYQFTSGTSLLLETLRPVRAEEVLAYLGITVASVR